MLIWDETPGQTQDTLERLYLLGGLSISWCSPGRVGRSGRGEERLDLPAENLAAAIRTQIRDRKCNEKK